RGILARDLGPDSVATSAPVVDPLAAAARLLRGWDIDRADARRLGPMPLYRDWWTGGLRAAGGAGTHVIAGGTSDKDPDEPVRSARMERRPEQRDAIEDEDKPGGPGVWMIQQD